MIVLSVNYVPLNVVHFFTISDITFESLLYNVRQDTTKNFSITLYQKTFGTTATK